MNKKEIFEIRRQLLPKNVSIQRICCCFVNAEKEKVLTSKEAFLSLSEDDMFKYIDIFRKSLSGKPNKNLLNMKYPTKTELPKQTFLLNLKDSHLTDDALVEEFYDKIIESYKYDSSYYIILAYGAYDVPGITADDLTLDDASENVYDYLLCSICPMNLSKDALFYDTEKNVVTDRIRDWIVDMPMHAFLWPSFNDRTSDIHEALLYTKKSYDIPTDFIEAVIGTFVPKTCEEQIQAYHKSIPETATLPQIMEINDHITEIYTANEEAVIDGETMKAILSDSGLDTEPSFEQPIPVSAICKKKKINIGDITVTADMDTALEVEVVNGRSCLVIPLETGMTFNDIPVTVVKS